MFTKSLNRAFYIYLTNTASVGDLSARLYVSDVNNYVSWLAAEYPRKYKTARSAGNMDFALSDKYIGQYISNVSSASPSLAKRRLVSLNHLRAFNYYRYGAVISGNAIQNTIPVHSTAFAVMLLLFLLVVISLPRTGSFGSASEEFSGKIAVPKNISLSTIAEGEDAVLVVQKPAGMKIFLSDEKELPAYKDSYPHFPAQARTASATIHGNAFTTHGESTIYSGHTSALIVNESIREESFVQITPYSPVLEGPLYVKEQGYGYMVIAVESPAGGDIKFRWKIDSTEIYHSMY